MMTSETPRWIPVTWAAIDSSLALAFLIVWRPDAYDFWWCVRGLVFAVFGLMGADWLRHAMRQPDYLN
jgi:hypothetical protein